MKDYLRVKFGIAVTAGILALSTCASMADANNTIASTAEVTGTAPIFTFDGTDLSLDAPLQVVATNVNGTQFSGYLSISSLTEVPNSASVGFFNTGALFGGGTFDISSTSAVTGDLLSGTFVSSVLSSPNSNGSTGDLTTAGLDEVQYTGGSFLTDYNAKFGGNGAVGDLTLDFSSINPTLGVTSSNLNSFTVEGSSTTFDAVAVPEANSASLVAFGGIGLIGLALRARKTRRLSA